MPLDDLDIAMHHHAEESYISACKEFEDACNVKDTLKKVLDDETDFIPQFRAAEAYYVYLIRHFDPRKKYHDEFKQEYKRLVKMCIREMFPVNLEKKLKQIAIDRRIPALRAWVAARKW
uniref:Uncharacterized protein n=1 Tax=viral metagenome TaxID=1070528 RepID=A0A6C0JW05_9ZZZZ